MQRPIRPVRALVALVMLALPLAGCDGSSVPAPRTIMLGQESCARCGHTIESLDAAAQVVYTDGTTRVYDDLGCLATDGPALRGGGQFYVQLSGQRGWMRVEDVHFASPKDPQSPRGYNYFAYQQDEAAGIDPHGWARGWADLVAELNRPK